MSTYHHCESSGGMKAWAIFKITARLEEHLSPVALKQRRKVPQPQAISNRRNFRIQEQQPLGFFYEVRMGSGAGLLGYTESTIRTSYKGFRSSHDGQIGGWGGNENVHPSSSPPGASQKVSCNRAALFKSMLRQNTPMLDYKKPRRQGLTLELDIEGEESGGEVPPDTPTKLTPRHHRTFGTSLTLNTMSLEREVERAEHAFGFHTLLPIFTPSQEFSAANTLSPQPQQEGVTETTPVLEFQERRIEDNQKKKKKGVIRRFLGRNWKRLLRQNVLAGKED
ncbi:hypothetical protein BDZ45DRAFT_747148 [Acephala macrosclerotiorum]|nr:hypothetical protein BDZ45DRAFT_747148 [Acephala macrosclerotiorum]